MSKSPPYADYADTFLKQFIDRSQRASRLRFFGTRFYRFEGAHFHEIPDLNFSSEVLGWLQRHRQFRMHANERTAREVIANVRAQVILPVRKKVPFWIERPATIGECCVSMQNGILDIDKVLAGHKSPLIPHTPSFFSTSAFPFAFSPEGQAPNFQKFLDEMVPQSETQALLQEWFGYHLDLLINFEKFVILFGEGANGKTVVLVALVEMLGQESISSVGLEAFNPERTFPLAATINKRGNIVGEIGEVDKAAEGLIKQFVSGNPITIEEKHRPAFGYFPTARLTFATNVLPRFTDRSDGIWRRLIPIPFKIQILDEGKQNKDLINPAWWRNSGELPGIFNWALGGLKRLRENRRFTDSGECRTARESYKKDSNPAKVFLTDLFEASDHTATIPSPALYQAYSDYSKQNGYHALASAQFAQEVRRVFPKAYLSENPVRLPSGKRSRIWYGLRFLGGTADTPFSDFFTNGAYEKRI